MILLYGAKPPKPWPALDFTELAGKTNGRRSQVSDYRAGTISRRESSTISRLPESAFLHERQLAAYARYFFSGFFSGSWLRVFPKVVALQPRQSMGSGFIVSPAMALRACVNNSQ